MTRREIVEKVAKEGLLDSIIKSVTGEERPEYKDLRQDLLLELLEEIPEKKLQHLYEKDQLRFYLLKVVKNNINSKTSRFYYKYRKFNCLNKGEDSLSYQLALDEQQED